MPFLDVNECALYYEVAGAGPPLVFAHGLGGNHMSWWQQVPFFADRYTCLTFAHRGFSPSVGAPNATRFADDLEKLLDHLRFDSAYLVAQSMGGWTCLDFTLRRPERVLGLVMASTGGSLRFDVELPPDPASALFERGIHPAAGERMALEQPELHHLYRLIDGLSVGLDKTALRRDLTRLRVTPPDALSDLRVPIQWIFGDEDVVIPPPIHEAIGRAFPDARIETVPRAGHSVYFERPAVFNAIVEAFLKSL